MSLFTEKKFTIEEDNYHNMYQVSVQDLYEYIHDSLIRNKSYFPFYRQIVQPLDAKAISCQHIIAYMNRWMNARFKKADSFEYGPHIIEMTEEFNTTMQKNIMELCMILIKRLKQLNSVQMKIFTTPDHPVDWNVTSFIKSELNRIGKLNFWSVIGECELVKQVCALRYPNEEVKYIFYGDDHTLKNLQLIYNAVENNEEPDLSAHEEKLHTLVEQLLGIIGLFGQEFSLCEINSWSRGIQFD